MAFACGHVWRCQGVPIHMGPTGDRSITAVPMESLIKFLSQKEHKDKLLNEIEDWALHIVDDEALAALFAAGPVWHLSVTPCSVHYVPPHVCVWEKTDSDTEGFRFTCLREDPESVIKSVKAWHQLVAPTGEAAVDSQALAALRQYVNLLNGVNA